VAGGGEKEDDEGDKSGAQGFQEPRNVINVIFGGDSGFPTKRAQKLTLREILSVEPAIQWPLRYNEVSISFSQEDQWTSFSKPGKFPLVLDPVVAGSQLTHVLIDGGSGRNLLFGLNISKMLTPSKALFCGIVPMNVATPISSVTLPVTLGQKKTTVRSTSSSRWQTLSHRTTPSLASLLWSNSWPYPIASTCSSRCQARQGCLPFVAT
jgi:hypothetical protein